MDYAGFVEIGYIQRTHGIKGEFQITWDESLNVNPQDLESVFVEIDGIPIPFFISSAKHKSDDRIIAKFDEVDDLYTAEELVGRKVLILSKFVPEDDDLELKDLVGYTVVSENDVVVGVITNYEEFNLNSIFYVNTPTNSEIILPAVEDLVIEVDVEAKIVKMEIPVGLIDLYSKG